MDTKVLEIRDRATRIIVIATKLGARTPEEGRLLELGGFDLYYTYVLLTDVETRETGTNPYNWSNQSLRLAHRYLIENFDSLVTGDVVDLLTIYPDR